MKQAFTTVPVLAHLDTSHPFVLEADASAHAIRAVLSQRGSLDGQLHPCAYFSCQLTAAERNYDAWDEELLAIGEACAEWRHLLVGPAEPPLVLTDHRNPEYFRNLKCLSPSWLVGQLFALSFH